MGVVATAVLLAIFCLGLCVTGLRKEGPRRYVLLSSLFLFGFVIATRLPRLLPIPQPGHYNWIGKTLSLLFALVVVGLLLGPAGWRREELGLTFRFNQGTGKDVARYLLPFLSVMVIAMWFMLPAALPTLEDYTYQLTMPGITEELAFRGILMALLDRAFRSKKTILGAGLGWSAVVTTLLFGLWHGLNVSPQLAISFDGGAVILPLLGGFALAWCRARAGNLVLPFLTHSLMNEAANILTFTKAKAQSK